MRGRTAAAIVSIGIHGENITLQPSASMLRAFGRGALCFAYIRVRLVCAHTTMHRMVVSPQGGGVLGAEPLGKH